MLDRRIDLFVLFLIILASDHKNKIIKNGISVSQDPERIDGVNSHPIKRIDSKSAEIIAIEFGTFKVVKVR